MIAAIHPMLNDDAISTVQGYEELAPIEMLEIVGSDRCLEMLHVLNDVFDSLERNAGKPNSDEC